ncbi:hypothetical protein PFICI_02390 [Pestalotiopsis fici W106-1]|uniref:SnoaL-like domain-containing protein n=1 Tax=Pestalotiopsis fici (strain W106-1 / CGMCC3.15140) TaxID=1229662 RepID=W3XE90_PESFW|nr:uncharacterized protein PFICI_02390 [Pestalotiopsis fici W106-1]ETS84365.1 hypothetical protein PFICI_02390 [Pestalotiopsis fici W106-1]
MASAPSQIPSETLSATATAWLDALGSLDPERLRAVMSPDYSHTFAPGSLTRLANSSKDREAMCGHVEHVGRVLTSFPIFPRQVWPNPSLRQVVVWADSKANFRDGATKGPDEDWEFAGEYMFVITMNETGDKVDKVLEFLDSKATERAWELMAKALKNLESQ